MKIDWKTEAKCREGFAAKAKEERAEWFEESEH